MAKRIVKYLHFKIKKKSIFLSSVMLIFALLSITLFSKECTAAEAWLWPISGSNGSNLSRGYSSGHKGVDIFFTGIEGKGIRAAKSGVVTQSSNSCPHYNQYAKTGDEDYSHYCNGGCGNFVTIDHGDGTKSRYLHLQQGSAIAVGTKVTRGQIIGKVGSSGQSSGPHCHFDIWVNGERINNNPGNVSYDYGSVSTSQDPIGNVDSATATTGKITVSGWAFDQDVPKTAIGVHVYVGGPAGSSGAEGHAFTANKSRPDVAKAYSSLNIGNNHGFAETFTTKKTGTQTLYFYAINAGGGTTNPQIGTKTVTIPKDTEKPKISNVKVTNITSKGYTVTCDVSDNVGVTQVKFPTWTAFSASASEQDDLKWHIGSISNGKASYTVKTSEHNNEVDINYVTHIYAYDAAGNSNSYTSAVRYIPGFTESEKLAFKPVATGIYGQSRYEVYDKSLVWTDAKAFCEKKGGHLVTITSKEENNAVLNLAKKGSKNYYAIGAESFNTLANWRWVTREAFSYRNWDPQATEGNTKGEPYAFIISKQNPPNKQSGEWVDGPNRCILNNYYHYQNSGFICEYTIVNKTADNRSPAKQNNSTQNKTNNAENKTTPSNGPSNGKKVNTSTVKAANPLRVKIKKKTYKQSKLTKKRSFMIGVSGAQGNVIYVRNHAAKKAKIKVSGKGKVIIPKRCKKGNYIIKVKAVGNSTFMSCTKSIIIKIK